MLGYLLRRLLYLPISLLLLSLLCFALTRITPGDPVEFEMELVGSRSADDDPTGLDRAYRRAAAQLGYDRPPFYFTLTHAAVPDTLYRIVKRTEREAARALAAHYGNWPAVQDFRRSLYQLAYANDSATGEEIATARLLLTTDDPELLRRRVATVPALALALQKLEARATPTQTLIPVLYWNGLDNQYHRYISQLSRGDLGTSYTDRRPVADKIADKLPWTLLLNGLALLVVYLLAIPLGLYQAASRGGRFDRFTTVLTFILFGIPSFWIATLLTNFFTTPVYGMNWFPNRGFGDLPTDAGLFTVLGIRAYHLFLPVLCLAFPSWAYVSRQLRGSAVTELDKPYVKTARLKGLAGSRVIWGHVFRNASFPLLTLLGSLLPALLAGSVLIERIFNLPGMGQLLFDSATARDWPTVIALVLFNGLLTALGLVLADVGYALVDPRVRLGERAGQKLFRQ